TRLEEAQSGPLTALPELPAGADFEGTAALIRAMLDGRLPVPAPIARQVEHILHLALQIESARPAP
ncbi:MAG: DNA-binding protein YbiB, partial [Burkholderiales bacterium]|nr:DNA-binding protein YbiB [Burkholderiales bacterium]